MRKKAFKNIVGKGENPSNQHFLLIPQYFLPYQKQPHQVNPFQYEKILDSSKLKEFADNNSKFDKSGRKVSKRGKTLGKGEIAHNGQFLLFPQCFQRPKVQTGKNKGLFGKGLDLIKFGLFICYGI